MYEGHKPRAAYVPTATPRQCSLEIRLEVPRTYEICVCASVNERPLLFDADRARNGKQEAWRVTGEQGM